MNGKKVELMAPAGSFESLRAAIQAGADSVYFGVEQLNMRVKSNNSFTLNDISEVTSICRTAGIKCYLAVNTIVYNHDLIIMKCIVDAAVKHGVDAIIASDPAVLRYSKQVGMPLHISTQANISNIQSLEFYAEYGDVMVLARELSLKQAEMIAKEIERRQIKGAGGELVKIELFAHGALCMAISGKCYLSLHSNYSSANRGACIQNCRHRYIVTDKESGVELEVDNEYIMSAKDLCTIDFVDQMIESGVSLLKIEGRGRSADYVYTVTRCYKEAIDSYYKGTYNADLVEAWRKRLETVFNRGFWDGYYLGRKLGEWNNEYGSKALKKKVYIGKGLRFYDDLSVGEFLLESQTLSPGDEILITGPLTGIIQTTVEDVRVNNVPRECVTKGEVFSFTLNSKIRRSDRIYKIINS